MKLRKRNLLGLLIVVLAPLTNYAQANKSIPSDIYEGLEFDMEKVQSPVFPDHSRSIIAFGAKGNGLFDNTQAFAATIAAVAEQGGGKVIVPAGIWLTGPIVFKSNINLHLENGALIVFSDDKSKYPLVKTSFEGLETYRCQSPIYGKDLENIAITGNGVIDGSGGAWRAVKKSKVAPSLWKRFVRSGGVLSDDEDTWYPSQTFKEANALTENFNVPPFTTKEEFEAVKEFLRPVMVSLVNCKKVLLDGPTFQNSPAWNLHPLMCEDVIIRNLTVRNPWYSQNGDGLDLESCKNVLIYNNSFDVGDDAICFKSGKNEDGRKRGMPTENVIVKNNVVYHGHGGFVVGSEMSGGVKNVHVSDCTFIGTDIGLRFKSTRGRGGVVENIYISDINMINIPTDAIRFNLYYGGKSPILDGGELDDIKQENIKTVPVTEETPSFKNIYISNVTATGTDGAGLFIQGLPEMNVKNIVLNNVLLEGDKGITLIDVNGINLKNVRVKNQEGTPLIIYNGANITLENSMLKGEKGEKSVRVLGPKSDNISLKNSGLDNTLLHIGKNVNNRAVTIK